MKKTLLILALLGASNLFAKQQQDSILIKEIPTIKNNIFQQRQEIDVLKTEVGKLSGKIKNQNYTIQQQKKSVVSLKEKNNQQKTTIDSLSNLIGINSQNITINSNQLGTEIQKVTTERNTQITALDDTIGKNRLYWIIATLGTLLLGGLMYLFLGKRIKSSKTDVETQIRNTKQSLEEESVKLDNKLVEILETQLKVKQAETKSQPTTSNKKEDHSLALKVADEVIRIQKNLGRMDDKTKGLKQLSSSVKRIQDNFMANGYELVEMIGKEYNEGMKATVNFVQDDDFEEGKRVITRIIKPQVNFKGTMIQTAQIEVTEA
ncbi:hypothetical protein [Tenacibaculum finnmarkense]|uniref:hypothetical protein n=1 Tax=Tenacibaculum finnmarkense TaxID=2781243 RepID=UPI003BB796BA